MLENDRVDGEYLILIGAARMQHEKTGSYRTMMLRGRTVQAKLKRSLYLSVLAAIYSIHLR
jgi:hypothetical protein